MLVTIDTGEAKFTAEVTGVEPRFIWVRPLGETESYPVPFSVAGYLGLEAPRKEAQ